MTTTLHLTDDAAENDRSVHFGVGVFQQLPVLLAEINVERIVVICGKTSFVASGAQQVVSSLPWELSCFNAVSSNPDIECVRGAVDAVRTFLPDVVVGVGGGSVLDVAKAASVLASQPQVPAGAFQGRIDETRKVKLILAPTTAGSGSEMTQFATVYDGWSKQSIDHPSLMADIALIDPDLTMSVPKRDSISSALDALAHGIESYWSVAASVESRSIARNAVSVVARAMSHAIARNWLLDMDLRRELALGACLGGRAINLTRTTAAHACSYWLTVHRGINHGAAVALNLPWVAMHNLGVTNADCVHPEGWLAVQNNVKHILEVVRDSSGHDLAELIQLSLKCAGIPTRLDVLVADAEGVIAYSNSIIESSRMANNPRIVSASDVRRALEE